jgi:hypothetical protein
MTVPEDLSFDLYIAFEQQAKLSKIVSLFRRAGWETRDCSWTEYEIQGDGVDLTLIPSSPPLLSGGVRDSTTTVDRVLAVLDSARMI